MPKNYEPKEEKRGCKESKQDIEHFQDRSRGSVLLTETFPGIAGSKPSKSQTNGMEAKLCIC